MRLAEAAVTKTERSRAAKIRIHPDRVRRWAATFARRGACSVAGAAGNAADLAGSTMRQVSPHMTLGNQHRLRIEPW